MGDLEDIDGIPLYQSDNQDLENLSAFGDAPLGAYFEMQSIQGEQGSAKYSNASVFADNGLTRYDVTEIINDFFPKATYKTTADKKVLIVQDPGSIIDKEAFKQFGRIEETKFVYKISRDYAYDVILFISRDQPKLKECYDKYNSGTKDHSLVVLFLEDNTGDTSPTFAAAVIGNQVRENLKDIEKGLYKNPNLHQYIEGEEKGNYDISQEALTRVLREGKTILEKPIDNALSIISFVLATSHIPLISPDKSLFQFISSKLGDASNYLRDTVKFDPPNWNPYWYGKEGDNEIENLDKVNKNFSPFFFPGINSLDNINDAEINNGIRERLLKFKSDLEYADAKIMSILKKDIGQVTLSVPIFGSTITSEVDFVPDSLEDFLEKNYIVAKKVVFGVLDDFIENFDLTDFIKHRLYEINALLCGVANGLTEFLAGIVDLLKLLFDGLAFMKDFQRDFKETFLNFWEQFDGIIAAIKEIDFKKAYSDTIKKLKNLEFFGAEINPYKIFYFGGMVIGFLVTILIELIIEIIVGAILSAGTLSVVAVVDKLGRVFANLGTRAVRFGAKAVNLGAKGVKGIYEGLLKLLRFLQKGTQNILKLIDDFFKWINKQLKAVKVARANLQKVKELIEKANYNGFYNKADLKKLFGKARHSQMTVEELEEFVKFGSEFKVAKSDLLNEMSRFNKLKNSKKNPDVSDWVDELKKGKIRYHLIDDVPGLKNFSEWFDNLLPTEFDELWKNVALRNKVKVRLRHPGGLHEWLMVSRTYVFKRWGVTVDEIKRIRTKIEKVIFDNPPGFHGGPGSTKAHNEILDLIDSSKSYNEFRDKLIIWADKRLKGGKNSLPKAIFE